MTITERKLREKQEMRALILQTARKLFVEEGFRNVSIRRIAELIEYSPATIYLYFEDKEDMLYALRNEGAGLMLEKLHAVDDLADPFERMRLFAQIYLQFALENSEYYDLMFITEATMGKIQSEDVEHPGRQVHMKWVGLVQDCLNAGYLPGAEVHSTSFGIWAAVHGIAALIIRQRCPMYNEEQKAMLANSSFELMMNMIRGSRVNPA